MREEEKLAKQYHLQVQMLKGYICINFFVTLYNL